MPTTAVTADAPTSPRLRRFISAATPTIVKLWPVPPQWESPVVERLEWRTDVLTAYDQTEQRRGLRVRPIRSFEYQIVTGREEQPHVEAIVYALQDTLIEVPIWTDARRIVSPLAAGAGAIPVTTSGLDYSAGGRVAILAPDYFASDYGVRDTSYEVLDVAAVGASSLTLSGGGPRRTWPARSFVVPVRSGRLASSISWSRPTDHGVQGSVRLDLEDPGHASLPSLVADTYRSRSVLPFRPDRGSDIQESMGRVTTRIQSVGGTLEVISRSDRPLVSRSGERFLFSGRTEIQQLRAWLEARAGRRSQFYLPSFQTDLELARPVEAANAWVSVKSMRGAALYGGPWGRSQGSDPYQNAGRQDIEIRRNDADTSPIRRRVLSWARGGEGVDQLKLDSAIGEAISDHSVAVLSWIALARQESDTVELRWLTADTVEAVIPMRSV